MYVIARRDDVADIDIDVVVRVDLDAALGLVLLELLAALFLKLRLVGVAVVVQCRYLVNAEEALGVRDVAGSVGVEVDDRAVLQFASTSAHQVVDAAVN